MPGHPNEAFSTSAPTSGLITSADIPRDIPVFRTASVLLSSAARAGYQRLVEKLTADGGLETLDKISICYMGADFKPLLLVSGDSANVQTTVLAPNKAYTAILLARDTVDVGPRMRELHVAPPSYGNDRITDFAGGVRIWRQDVGTIGGVGVSGLDPLADHKLALVARDLILEPYPEFESFSKPGFYEEI